MYATQYTQQESGQVLFASKTYLSISLAFDILTFIWPHGDKI